MSERLGVVEQYKRALPCSGNQPHLFRAELHFRILGYTLGIEKLGTYSDREIPAAVPTISGIT